MRLTSGGILTTGYSSRTIGYFPDCFLEIFMGGQGLMGEEQSHDRRGSPSSPTGENPDPSLLRIL